MPSIQFLGAAGVVTGSKHLVETDRTRLLVDCGLFQGGRDLKQRNWEPFPRADELDAIVLTHAHLDHVGYLPRLIREGFEGLVHATPGTADLASLVLPDAGYLQEEEAHFAMKKGYSRHPFPEPLFTALDAQRALRHLRALPYEQDRQVALGVSVRFRPAGHIIGAATAELEVEGESLVFSGDLGRSHMALLKGPAPVKHADVLVVESTYGDRLHPPENPHAELAKVVRESVHRGGILVVPAFAVGRTQELLLMLRRLEDAGEIPFLDVFVDSPMAVGATSVTLAHAEDFNAEARAMLDRGALMPRRTHLVRDVMQSKALNAIQGPGIIISASGMATGGRVKHHLAQRLPDARNTVCLAGYQAEGTRGRQLEEGASHVWLFGDHLPVRATVARIQGLSAHADRGEILTWLKGFEQAPRETFIVHGEPVARQALARIIHEQLGWSVTLPEQGQRFAVGRQAGHDKAAR